jgi:hypothetical protein
MDNKSRLGPSEQPLAALSAGLSAIASQLTGFLFFENVKMERQRTNLPYRQIIPKFLTPRTFINGFLPYGAIHAFSKGFIFGLNQQYVAPNLNYSQPINNLILGLSTGITEATIISPLLYIRTHLNENVTNNTNKKLKIDYKSIFKGCNVLILKRCVDWTTRFTVIDYMKQYSPVNNIVFNTFIGAGISAIFSSPIDRVLPIIYSGNSIIAVIKEQRLSFLYKGFTFRFLSTGYYTTFLLLLPKYINKIIDI